MASDGIHRRRATTKIGITAKQKQAQYEWCLEHRNRDWRTVAFVDESFFETGTIRSRHARGVLRRAGEAYLDRCINRTYQNKGVTVMIFGLILYGYNGGMLPLHIWNTPIETAAEKEAAEKELDEEFRIDQVLASLNPTYKAVRKERCKNRKGGIDWFLYRKHVLYPLVYPFLQQASAAQGGVQMFLVEDGASSHKSKYHHADRIACHIQKLSWPSGSPDLNPIELLWNIIKDRIRNQLGRNLNAENVRQVIKDTWRSITVAEINNLIDSMSARIEACIRDGGGNNFHF